jgi:hypothetical protein
MNYDDNLKSTQLRKLFRIFNSRSIQNLNIFGAREGFQFKVTNLSWIGIRRDICNRAGSTSQWPKPVLTAHLSHWTRATCHQPSHHVVPALTAMSAQTPFTAGCRHYPMPRRPHGLSGEFPPHFASSFKLLLALVPHCSAPHPPTLFADEPLTQPLPVVPWAPELLQRVMPPSAREVTGHAMSRSQHHLSVFCRAPHCH